MTFPDNLDSPSTATPKANGTSPIWFCFGNGNLANNSKAILNPLSLTSLKSDKYFFCKPKNPLIGSLAGVKGNANNAAPAEMILRCNGQSLSISTPAAYAVPKANGYFSKVSNIVGTTSGGCCKSASMHTKYSPWASLKPVKTAELKPRSLVRTMMFTFSRQWNNAWEFGDPGQSQLRDRDLLAVCYLGNEVNNGLVVVEHLLIVEPVQRGDETSLFDVFKFDSSDNEMPPTLPRSTNFLIYLIVSSTGTSGSTLAASKTSMKSKYLKILLIELLTPASSLVGFLSSKSKAPLTEILTLERNSGYLAKKSLNMTKFRSLGP